MDRHLGFHRLIMIYKIVTDPNNRARDRSSLADCEPHSVVRYKVFILPSYASSM